jgi:hypothetical protein
MCSDSDSVVRHAPCPALVVCERPLTFSTKMLLATGGSEDKEALPGIGAPITLLGLRNKSSFLRCHTICFVVEDKSTT